MPTLNLRYRDEDERAAPDALRHHGPLVGVTLSPIHDPEVTVTGLVLIDTGAAQTCVDAAKAREARMSLVGSGRIGSAAGEAEVPLFAAVVDIEGLGRMTRPRCLGVDLEGQGIVALIGRDLLRMGVLVYNGQEGTVSLSL